MHPFSGPALWSLKKRAGCLIFYCVLCFMFVFCVVACLGAPNNGGNTT